MITTALLGVRLHVSRLNVAQFMKKQNLQIIIRKSWVVTNYSRNNYPIAETKHKRDLNRAVWISNTIYIKTWKGWLYLTVTINLYDRKVIGCAFSRYLKAVHSIIPARRLAVRSRSITKLLIFHSDCGVQ
jgi:putative transposase